MSDYDLELAYFRIGCTIAELQSAAENHMCSRDGYLPPNEYGVPIRFEKIKENICDTMSNIYSIIYDGDEARTSLSQFEEEVSLQFNTVVEEYDSEKRKTLSGKYRDIDPEFEWHVEKDIVSQAFTITPDSSPVW